MHRWGHTAERGNGKKTTSLTQNYIQLITAHKGKLSSLQWSLTWYTNHLWDQNKTKQTQWTFWSFFFFNLIILSQGFPPLIDHFIFIMISGFEFLRGFNMSLFLCVFLELFLCLFFFCFVLFYFICFYVLLLLSLLHACLNYNERQKENVWFGQEEKQANLGIIERDP